MSIQKLEPYSLFLVIANSCRPHSFRKLVRKQGGNYSDSIEATSMRMKSTVFSVAALVGTVAIQSSACAEDYRGTMDQQMACTPDVWRLCGDQIPDVNRIVACLRANTPQLSEPCRAVFDTSNRVDPAPRRGRRPPAAAEPVRPQPREDDWFR